MKIPDIESLVGRVEQFFGEVKSGGKPAQYRKGRATSLRAEVNQAMTGLRQLLEELCSLGQNLDRIVKEANKNNVPSLPTTALT